jgi:two-component system, NtrC family, sensor histidine kinase HydH
VSEFFRPHLSFIFLRFQPEFHMKFPIHIQSRYIIAITAVVAVVMVTSAIIELRQSRSELFHVMEEEALSLVETIELSSANNLLSMEQVEGLLADRLLNNAFFVARLDSMRLLDAKELQRIAETNHIFRINIFNRHGNKILSSYSQKEEHSGLLPKHTITEVLKPILRGEVTQLVIGLKEARFEEGQRYAVAVRRTVPSGGAIVLNLNADDLLEFRKTLGIGRLINDLGDNSGLEYVVLQDRQGILAASKSIQEMTPIDSDSLLVHAYKSDSALTRVVPFHNRDILEVVKLFALEGATIGLFRIGFSMEEIQATEARMQRRVLIMSVVLLVLGALVLLAIVAMQNFKLMEQKYGVMQTFTGNILEHMQDAVVTVDHLNRISLFNKQAETLFGIAATDVVGRRVDELGQGGTGCLSQVFSEEKPHGEMSIQCAGGVQREVAVTLSDTLRPDGTPESRTALIKDLTEERRLEREIRRKDKLTAMGELASGVAHEVRNPINAINMIAQRFQKEFSPKKGVKEYQALAGVLRSEAQRVNGIIQQFLRFARPAKLILQPIAAQEFISHVSKLFEGQARAKDVRFSCVSKCEIPLTIDRDQMTQAMLNILQNALDATPAGGSIGLSCLLKDNAVIFTVEDTGKGIPKNELDKVFNLYHTTKPDGTGMGLAITHQIILQHHGTVEVESEEGRGSRFILTFPLKQSAGGFSV